MITHLLAGKKKKEEEEKNLHQFHNFTWKYSGLDHLSKESALFIYYTYFSKYERVILATRHRKVPVQRLQTIWVAQYEGTTKTPLRCNHLPFLYHFIYKYALHHICACFTLLSRFGLFCVFWTIIC